MTWQLFRKYDFFFLLFLGPQTNGFLFPFSLPLFFYFLEVGDPPHPPAAASGILTSPA